jgi:hypothetical protein
MSTRAERRHGGASFAPSRDMAGDDRRSDRIRALIEEVDRVRRESERITNHLERSMKRPFWPERRRSMRMPPPSEQPDRRNDGS